MIEDTEIALSRGARLFDWWQQAEVARQLQTFPLLRKAELPDSMLAFFSALEAEPPARPVMGCLQQLSFRLPGADSEPAVLAEFIQRRFLTICRWKHPDGRPAGFGYRPLFYLDKESGQCGTFEQNGDPCPLDLRDIGKRYEWVVLRVDIFDFVRAFPPARPFARALSGRIRESAYVVIHEDYSRSEVAAPPDVRNEFRFGYSFLPRAVEPNIFGFGPGRFDAAVKQFRFQLLDSGALRIQLAFIVAPRSQKVLNLRGFDPVYSLVNLADFVTLGRFRIRPRMHDRFDAIMLRLHGQVHQNLLDGMRGVWEEHRWS